MSYGRVPTVAFALVLLSAASAGAATSSRCHMEVLSSEELPYALVGDWLLKATVRITYPQGASASSTFVKSTPWRTTLRRGDNFWFDCERLGELTPTQ